MQTREDAVRQAHAAGRPFVEYRTDRVPEAHLASHLNIEAQQGWTLAFPPIPELRRSTYNARPIVFGASHFESVLEPTGWYNLTLMRTIPAPPRRYPE